MKTVTVTNRSRELKRLLEIARHEDLVVRTPEGDEFVLSAIDDFAQEIARQAGLSQVRVDPLSTSASGRPARRPRNSRLANARLEAEGLSLLPPWQDGLRRYLLRVAETKA